MPSIILWIPPNVCSPTLESPIRQGGLQLMHLPVLSHSLKVHDDLHISHLKAQQHNKMKKRNTHFPNDSRQLIIAPLPTPLLYKTNSKISYSN